MNTTSSLTASPRRRLHRENLIRPIIAIDGIVNVMGAIVLWAGSSAWASAFGLENTLPVIALGAVFLVNGVGYGLTARRPVMPTGWLRGLAAVDFVFGAGALAIAAIDPTNADDWARWVLSGVGDAALVVGVVKAYGASRTAPAAE